MRIRTSSRVGPENGDTAWCTIIVVNEVELHQLDRRYESLRRREPRREARLLASLSEHGQQIPIVVVGDHVVVDGFKRLRALAKLAHDTVAIVAWSLDERDALLLGRMMRTADEDALEQGWLLSELRDRFSMSSSEMAQRFDKSESWVSRRLALVVDLPREVQELVRAGALGAHAAMKYFVPLARANRHACVQLAAELSRHRLSTRQIGAVYAAWMAGDEAERIALITDPLLFLRAMAVAKAPEARLRQTLATSTCSWSRRALPWDVTSTPRSGPRTARSPPRPWPCSTSMCPTICAAVSLHYGRTRHRCNRSSHARTASCCSPAGSAMR